MNVDLYSALSWSHLWGAQVWHAFTRDLSFTCTPRVRPLTEWTIPAFAFPAEACAYLPTPDLRMARVTYEINVRHWECPAFP